MVHTRHGYLVRNVLLVPDENHGWRWQRIAAASQALPGLMIYRFMHSMYYANTQVLTREVVDLARNAQPPLSWFCIDMGAVDDVDFTAAEALRALHGVLGRQGTRLLFSEFVDDVKTEFERSHLIDLFGPQAFFPTPIAVLSGYAGATGDKAPGAQ